MEELVIACVGKTGWALTATKIQKQNSDVFFDTIMMDLHHWSLWLGIIQSFGGWYEKEIHADRCDMLLKST